ncbi:MAG: LON peptidase substrate-binding domain-containing protein [Raineya sp.]
MSTYLPLFPLNLVAFPSEKLNLHIFEPRYRQLIQECIAEQKTFGIPVFIRENVQDLGTEMRVVELVKKYADGRMDIRTEGLRVFRINTFYNPAPGKLYAAGKVEFFETDAHSDWLTKKKAIELIDQLYAILGLENTLEYEKDPFSFQVAHKIGLSLEQEYQLLAMLDESQRIEFLIEHLEKSIPIIKEVERTKQLIRMNGHFKNLNPLNF